MEKIKNVIYVFSVFLVVLGLTGCGPNKNVEGTLPEIMENVYEKMYAEVKETDRPVLETVNILEKNPDITEEDMLAIVEYTIGTSDIEYKEIYESRPRMGSIAYSVVLVRMQENADIEAAKKAIKENVDPRKWVCVGVERDELIIKNKGDLIILIIVENETLREKIEEGFDSL